MKKILLVFGTRPEAIKMAPLVKEFQKNPKLYDTKVCVTAQHREMLDQVLQLFEIVPDYDLNIMKEGQDLYDVTSRVLLGMREVLKESKPDLVFVHGDTSTSTAAALAAFYQQIPVAHIEAGLRTHNIYSPWPEELNRQITSRIATKNYAPTKLSKLNLLSEGIQKGSIFVTGNTIIDALYWVLDKFSNDSSLTNSINKQLINFGLPLEKLTAWENSSNSLHFFQSKHNIKTDIPKNNEVRKMVLITGHRRENFGQGFLNICQAIRDLSSLHPEVDFVYPMHLNPNVRKPISEIFGNKITSMNEKYSIKNIITSVNNFRGLDEISNVYFIEPLDYLPFIYLMNLSYLVLTDSGGIQEEAPGLGKPVLVMRDTTERPEALEAGTVKLVGTDRKTIKNSVSALINDNGLYLKMSKANNPYGDGKACLRILEVSEFGSIKSKFTNK